MAFVVETGAGIKDANSYGSVDEFKSYHADRGNSITSITDPTGIQQALINATDYIDSRWRKLFKGERQFLALASRSLLTLSGQPVNNETVVVGGVTYTFKTTPSTTVQTEVEIGATAQISLENLVIVMDASDNEDLSDAYIPDPDAPTLVVYTKNDGVATTETLTNGSFDVAASIGSSRKQQPLEFPRKDLYDNAGNLVSGVPDELRQATFEYAIRAASSSLSPDPATSTVSGTVTAQKTKVGPIETETRYSEGSGGTQKIQSYPEADRLLSEYIRSTGRVTRM